MRGTGGQGPMDGDGPAAPSSPLREAVLAFRSGDLDRARALAEGPASAGSADADHLLGLIHCRRGDFGRGLDHLERAHSAQPDNPAFELMLLRALVDAGRAREVLARPVPEPASTPQAAALWHVRAEAAEAAGSAIEAAECWRVLAEARPTDWRPWVRLGDALARLDRWAEAASALGRAAALNTDDPGLRRNLAGALASAGDSQGAATQMEAAIALDGNDLPSRIALVTLLGKVAGRESEAVARLDEAAALLAGKLAVAGDLSTLFAELQVVGEPTAKVRELGLLLERARRIDALARLLDLASKAGHRPGDLGSLHALLAMEEGRVDEARDLLMLEAPESDPPRWWRLKARIEDSLGNWAQAFEAARQMNLATPDFDRWREKSAAYRAHVRSLAALYTPEWLGRIANLPAAARPAPVFLVGFPRSGTTLLDTFLMGHPQLCVVEEQPMLAAAEQAMGGISKLGQASAESLERARAAYFAELDRHVPAGFDGLAVDKLPLNMVGVPLIRALFPEARIIFAQRHPCDAVLSGFMQSFVLNDAMACFLAIDDAADLYDAAMSAFTAAADSLRPRLHRLVYEELVRDPEAALRPLLSFLDLDWRPELLDHRATAARRGAILTPSYDQVVRPLDRRPSGRWRHYEGELRPVLPRLLPWAERLGYSDLA